MKAGSRVPLIGVSCRVASGVSLIGLAFLLSACAPMAPAPVEQRDTRSVQRSAVVPTVYSVRRGDTLYSIAFRYRLDWREIARWNQINRPYLIRPGQELRLVPPPRRVSWVSEPAPETLPEVEAEAPPQPVPRQPEQIDPVPETPVRAPDPIEPQQAPDQAPQPSTVEPTPSVVHGPTRRVSGIEWRWPTAGRVSRPFDSAATRRGIGISGNEGQPVVAAADGEVVYSGTALIGYGELIIIKHSDRLLSAYAHNRVRLVSEGARVRGGQPIAELGISDRNEELLHFEVRRNGQPVNPLDFLPRR